MAKALHKHCISTCWQFTVNINVLEQHFWFEIILYGRPLYIWKLAFLRAYYAIIKATQFYQMYVHANVLK